MRPLAMAAATLLAIAQPICAPPAEAAACRPHTPPVGSVERKAILNVLRPRVEAWASTPIEFVVLRMDVACGYARVIVRPREKGGDRAQYEDVDALLLRWNGAWRFGMIASSEPDTDPHADQYTARYPGLPESLRYL